MVSNLAKISGLIYIAGDDGISLSNMSKLLNISEAELLINIDKLNDRLVDDSDSPFTIIKYDDKYTFATKDELDSIIKDYIVDDGEFSLTQTSLEVLTIIAYNQPITRVEIDDIRGVNSNKTIQKLIKQEIIKVNGHKKVPGNPKLYEVTGNFFKLFGISSLDELPKIDKNLLTREEK
ncbi:SMC-Scp complex subunit ScpB [Apilactobacillus quenuiae]|uniref:SMC-Scp complex subunit ScpB n=1 Tax=Apilactobacillus quenuiae TaxID=2008377 RepID=UPI000D01C0CF|nr:SMC-Scp complex subunit ScpB [Apilactobacillus quenuiae]